MAIGSPKHSCPFLDAKCPRELGIVFPAQSKGMHKGRAEEIPCVQIWTI